MKYQYSIGIDLGGTKVASALVRSDGKIISYLKDSVLEIKSIQEARLSQKKMIQLMVSHCQKHLDKNSRLVTSHKLKGIGLASAGPLNVKSGELIYPSNFPNWKKFPIVADLKKELKAQNLTSKVFFQNDAVASALAEGWTGGAKNLNSYAVITIGTGIGTGVIFNQKPVQSEGMGSEFGHLIVSQFDNSSFYKKTVEGLASGTALVKRANEEFNFKCTQVEDIILALKTRPDLKALFNDMSISLAALCYNLSIGFHLEKILFSGGLSKVNSLYLPKTRIIYKENINLFNKSFLTSLSLAKTGNKSGVIGSARLPYLS
ncbi:MAG TPA: ROK family protein [Pseudobdellovibrionaceae bacterium]|nr:ROK family protein [Pseudobdellovibrionaceae bacterium]